MVVTPVSISTFSIRSLNSRKVKASPSHIAPLPRIVSVPFSSSLQVRLSPSAPQVPDRRVPFSSARPAFADDSADVFAVPSDAAKALSGATFSIIASARDAAINLFIVHDSFLFFGVSLYTLYLFYRALSPACNPFHPFFYLIGTFQSNDQISASFSVQSALSPRHAAYVSHSFPLSA